MWFNVVESEIMCKVTHDCQDLRSRLKPYEDLHDYKTIEQYKSHREEKVNRTVNKINNRFPSLTGQRSNESLSPEDHYLDTKEIQILPIPKDSERSFKNYTLSQTLKLRKLVQPENQLEKSMSKAFIPVNPIEAKSTIMRTVQYEPDNDPSGRTSHFKLNTLEGQSQHKSGSALQQEAFKRSSPSPDHIQKQFKALNDSNNFRTFLPTEMEQPRLTVLHNFKEISRIMTNNFLKHKELEKKYKNTQLPREDQQRKQFEEDCTQKMTYIMKQMNSPKNFCSPSKRGFGGSSSLSRVPLNDLSTQGSKMKVGQSFRGLSNSGSKGATQLPQIKIKFTAHNPEEDRNLNHTIL